MNITVEPGMTLDMSSGCVVILGGSTERGREGEERERLGRRRGFGASDRMNTKSVQAQTIRMLIGGGEGL